MQTKNTVWQLNPELANSLTHLFGILFGIIGIPILIALAAKSNNTAGLVGASIYGFCFLMLFIFSTLYHGFQQVKVKRVLQIFDHISIYFLIAGTYTPFLLIYMSNAFGITLLSALWGLTVLGIVFKTFFTGKWEILSTIIYLLMGWMMVAGGKTFFAELPTAVLILVITGGGLYTIGVIFYLWDKYTYSHAVWHSFVLSAAICHYVAILLSV